MALSDEFKVGSEHKVGYLDLLMPLKDKVVHITFATLEGPVTCRVIDLEDGLATVKVVPPGTKE